MTIDPAFALGLRDRYIIERELGSGGMATVYLARDLRHERLVALKVLRPVLREEHGPRFLREIRLAANLQHAHILPVFDSGNSEGTLWYTMPYVQGETLRERLRREPQLPLPEAVRIAREVADALSYAHDRGVIHRDIKPANILLSGEHAVVADFGIAKAVDTMGGDTLTDTGVVVGTPQYMSPEQAGSIAAVVDGRTDIYGLGCVLFEMLAGEPPFTGTTPQAVFARSCIEPVPSVRTIRDVVPLEIEKALNTALAKLPADRFARAGDFARALALEAAPSSRGQYSGLHLLRQAAWLLAAAAALGLAALVPRVIRFSRSRPQPAATTTVWDQITFPVGGWKSLTWNSCFGCAQSLVDAPNVRGAPEWMASVGDTILLVSQPNLGRLLSYDGHGWQVAAHYDRKRLGLGLQAGGNAADTLVAFGVDTGLRNFYIYRLGARGFGTSAPMPMGAQASALWIGKEWVIGTEAGSFIHGTPGHWIRRSGASAPITRVWGTPSGELFAIASRGSAFVSDSLMAFDGRRWRQRDALPDSTMHVHYAAGTTLEDGTTVLAGTMCDTARCRPLLLHHRATDSAWREIHLRGLGALRPSDVWDGDHGDYFLGGTARQSPLATGCDFDTPCLIHMIHEQAVPEIEVKGRRPIGMARLENQLRVLFSDGTLWRYTGGQFQYESEIPDLELQDLSASRLFGVVAVGRDGSQFGLMPTGTAYIPDTTDSGRRYDRVVLADTGMALLDGAGQAFRSRCTVYGRTMRYDLPFALNCSRPLLRLFVPRSRRLRDIAVREEGTLVGVGDSGLVVTWTAGTMRSGNLPPEAAEESLFRIVAPPGLPPTALGHRFILQEASEGDWRIVGRLMEAEVGRAYDLALTGAGVLVVSSSSLAIHWRLTLYPSDSAPRLLLEDTGLPPRILALPNGRIVLGHAYPKDRSFGGWLTVLTSVQDTVGKRIEVPNKMDVQALTDDGKELFVAGNGLQIAFIPLDSLR